MEVRREDLANWTLRTSPKFTTGVKYQFVVEDLPSGRTAALVPEFAVTDLPLGRTLDDIQCMAEISLQ